MQPFFFDNEVADFVQQVRIRQPRLGGRKLHYLLQQLPESVLYIGRHRLFSVFRERRLLVPPKRAYQKTTHSHHRSAVIPIC